MPPKSSRRLVIDASVACSAGEPSAGKRNERAVACRDVLGCVLSISHRIIMTQEIYAECEKHPSRYFSAWLVKMQRLKKVDFLALARNEDLRGKIEEIIEDKGIVKAIHKDMHLIEAALASDQTVISLDEKVKGYLAIAASDLEEIGAIVWVNPEIKKERAVSWLEEGANPETSRKLGYRRR